MYYTLYIKNKIIQYSAYVSIKIMQEILKLDQ